MNNEWWMVGSAGRGSRLNHHAREQRKEMSEAVRLCGDRSPVVSRLPHFFPSSVLPFFSSLSISCLSLFLFFLSLNSRPSCYSPALDPPRDQGQSRPANQSPANSHPAAPTAISIRQHTSLCPGSWMWMWTGEEHVPSSV